MGSIQPLLLTLQLIGVAVTIAAVIGIVGAWATSILEASGRAGKVLSRMFLASMVAAIVMPMILHAAAWEATAGKFGWMIMTQTGARADTSSGYGFFGGLLACGWIHGLVGAAIVALAVWYGVGRTSAAVISQSRLDVGPIAAWWRVRLPIAMPWLVSALVATALLAATEMTVVDLYGYRTLADEFYLFYAADPSIASVLMTCVVPLAIAAVVLTWMLVSRRQWLPIQAASDIGRSADPLSTPWQWFARMVVIAVASLIVVVPVAGLLIKVGHQVTVENDLVQTSWSMWACVDRLLEAPRTFADEYRWTAILALLTGMMAVVIAWPMAAIARTHPRPRHWIDPATILMVIVPGPIVGLAVVSFFQADVPGFRTLYQQSLVPTMMALLVRAVPVAYWILRAGYQGIGTSVLEAAKLDGSWLQRIWFIDRKLLAGSLMAAALAAGVVASGDVPATLPVIPAGVTTVGTRLFGLLHSGARYQEAALAIWYVGAVVGISLILIRQTVTSHVRV